MVAIGHLGNNSNNIPGVNSGGVNSIKNTSTSAGLGKDVFVEAKDSVPILDLPNSVVRISKQPYILTVADESEDSEDPDAYLKSEFKDQRFAFDGFEIIVKDILGSDDKVKVKIQGDETPNDPTFDQLTLLAKEIENMEPEKRTSVERVVLQFCEDSHKLIDKDSKKVNLTGGVVVKKGEYTDTFLVINTTEDEIKRTWEYNAEISKPLLIRPTSFKEEKEIGFRNRLSETRTFSEYGNSHIVEITSPDGEVLDRVEEKYDEKGILVKKTTTPSPDGRFKLVEEFTPRAYPPGSKPTYTKTYYVNEYTECNREIISYKGDEVQSIRNDFFNTEGGENIVIKSVEEMEKDNYALKMTTTYNPIERQVHKPDTGIIESSKEERNYYGKLEVLDVVIERVYKQVDLKSGRKDSLVSGRKDYDSQGNLIFDVIFDSKGVPTLVSGKPREHDNINDLMIENYTSVSEEFASAIKEGLDSIPLHVRSALFECGNQVILAIDPEALGRRGPAGDYFNRMNENINGWYSQGMNITEYSNGRSIRESRQGAIATLRHETGHGFHAMVGYSNDLLIAAYKKDFAELKKQPISIQSQMGYFVQPEKDENGKRIDATYTPAGVGEAVAHAFAVIHGGDVNNYSFRFTNLEKAIKSIEESIKEGKLIRQ